MIFFIMILLNNMNYSYFFYNKILYIIHNIIIYYVAGKNQHQRKS